MYSRSLLLIYTLVMGTLFAAEVDEDSPHSTEAAGFDDLFNVKVSSVSSWEEYSSEVPASVIVISGKELISRGYRDLSQVLDHLPGMSITRPYGDNYFKVIWRGVRHNIGSSHIILVDGVEFNHLYFAEAEVLAALPINQVKQIEIAYGPASAVYGANAFVGVINVVTRHNDQYSQHRGGVRVGSNQARIVDDYYATELNDWKFSAGVRMEEGEADSSNWSRYHYTQPSYLADPLLWGAFLSNPNFGEPTSPKEHRGLDLRVKNASHEFALQHFQLGMGYGNEYPSDKVQPNGIWLEQETSFYYRYNVALSDELKSRTLIRWRKSGVDRDSDFLEGYNITDAQSGFQVRVLDYSFWQTKNYSYSFEQSLLWNISHALEFNTGISFDYKKLQKAYDVNFGPSLPVDSVANYPYPTKPDGSSVPNNKIHLSEKSGFALFKYHLDSDSDALNQWLHFGLRFDNQTNYGSHNLLRLAYVANWEKQSFKIQYGEAFEAPPPRLLYGGWQGAGSDPSLKPQRGETLELSYDLSSNGFDWRVSAYRMEYMDVFLSIAGGAVNSGEGVVNGLDLTVSKTFFPDVIQQVKWTSAFSYIDSKSRDNTSSVWQQVGDMAPRTWSNILDFSFSNQWSGSLQHAWVDDKPTVATNPIAQVDGYSLFNMSLIYQPDVVDWNLSLSVYNLLDEVYAHPGIRQANAGNEPGYFNNNGEWIGSQGFYSSLLPQPGREFLLSFNWFY